MSKYIKKIGILSLVVLSLLIIIFSCKSKDPSILKVFVRDENNELLTKAKVVIIGDTKSDPPTIDYVDTNFTDDQGVALFDMEEFFTTSGESVKSGYFNILVKFGEKIAEGRVRVKQHIVSVETVTFQP
jgi:hypothetical protein